MAKAKAKPGTVGTITGFSGSWGSGLATLFVDGVPIPCDNGATVRALASCFEDVITSGHCVNVSALIGKRIRYGMDDFGLCLGWVAQEES